MTPRAPMTPSCPDWRDLTAYRHEGRETSEPTSWQEALEHLDRCPSCRQSAVQADPTLVFRSLPGLAWEMSAAEEAAEVESMRQAVATLRTARRLEPAPERAVWKHWVAAAALAAAALSLGAGHGLHRGPAGPAGSATFGNALALAVPTLPAGPRLGATAQVAPRFVSEPVPMVEELNRPAARVYQMDGGKNLSVVMIVDERFDV
jgi:hypothetical protein